MTLIPTEHSLFMGGLRKRTVSFSTLLTEEIEEIKEHSDSDSDNEGNDSSLQESHAEEGRGAVQHKDPVRVAPTVFVFRRIADDRLLRS